ncbi:hypothetical protein CYMTET_50011 [Cymbomonas tetramitiformis]|uniref:Uncharacterized protein n=1 Tax=Cymbomonas tetramitiformis TaxID=36881 RepID=A0AAE0ETZ1_9CHLO|nr:hypothetical protein CYMTET_50011 [Cymbomonas tetramitiformis]
MGSVINEYIRVSDESADQIASMFAHRVALQLAEKDRSSDANAAKFFAFELEKIAQELRDSETLRVTESPSVETVKSILRDVPLQSPAVTYFGDEPVRRKPTKRLSHFERCVPVEELTTTLSDMAIQPTLERSDSAETTKSEAISQSVAIFTKLECEFQELESKYLNLEKKFEHVSSVNGILNKQVADLQSELSETCEEKAALSVGNEKLMFEIAEKELENSKLVEELKKWKGNAKHITEQHRKLLKKVSTVNTRF